MLVGLYSPPTTSYWNYISYGVALRQGRRKVPSSQLHNTSGLVLYIEVILPYLEKKSNSNMLAM